MIVPISRENIEQLYPVIAIGLERALVKTSLGKFWSLHKMYDHVINYEAYAFHQPESGYSGVFSLGSAPLGNVLHFFWSGKDPENTTPVDYAEIDAMLTQAALHFNCRFIQCEGRRGWKPILAPFGYAEDSTNYVKEVYNGQVQTV